MHTRSQDVAAWVRSRVMAAGAAGVAVPLRGTIESAVVARLSQLAMPDRVLGVILRGDAADADGGEAAVLAGYLQLPAVTIDMPAAGVFSNLDTAVASVPRGSRDNSDGPGRRADLGERLRMAALYFVAESMNYLTAGTLDRTDLILGTFARYGGEAVDVLPLGSVLRSEVLALAKDLQLPPALGESAIAADEARRGTVGVSHHHLEQYLAEGPDAVAPAVALKIERLMRESERKRRAAAVPEGD
jgi:NAD+ synthase